jgi:hypothetical protein
MELFRYSRSIYGGSNQLIGANWDLLPLFVGVAIAFIILHAVLSARAKRRRQGSS